MKVSGFTILRQAVTFGYPFEASIRSLLPLVDELVIGVGDGDDGTWEAVTAIGDPRLKPFRTVWRVPTAGGLVLSEQTNLALARCTGDWAIYLQGDEVLHEDDVPVVQEALRRHHPRPTEGLVFRYLHFWRDYHHVADDWLRFYPRAVRAVRRLDGIESAGDACGFTRRRGSRARGLIKADSGARVFHYGWCNPPQLQAARVENLGRHMFGEFRDDRPETVFAGGTARRFAGSHPRLMAGHVDAGGPPQPMTTTRTAPWLRAASAVLQAPLAHRDALRPLLPLSLTNTWWRIHDWRRG